MKNLEKSTPFEIFIFIQQWLTHNMWYIGVTLNSSKKSSKIISCDSKMERIKKQPIVLL
jgi:hypothetical protein